MTQLTTDNLWLVTGTVSKYASGISATREETRLVYAATETEARKKFHALFEASEPHEWSQSGYAFSVIGVVV